MTIADPTWRLQDHPDDPRHGTPNGYNNLDCRCPRCTAANTAAQARRREARRNAPTPRHVHGTDAGYREYGCDCKRCKAAHATARKASRDRTGK